MKGHRWATNATFALASLLSANAFFGRRALPAWVLGLDVVAAIALVALAVFFILMNIAFGPRGFGGG